MAIKLNTDSVINRSVDQSQSVSLSRGQGHLGVRATVGALTLTIDENVGTIWGRQVLLKVVQCNLVHVVCKAIVEIVDWERAKVNVVVGTCRTVDHNLTSDSHTILR